MSVRERMMGREKYTVLGKFDQYFVTVGFFFVFTKMKFLEGRSGFVLLLLWQEPQGYGRAESHV